MKKQLLIPALVVAGGMLPTNATAQLSQNPDKFLGNITTRGQVNYNGVEFASLWNQMTGENESKWASVEGSRGRFNWTGTDNCYNYCRDHGIPYKFHTLVWGSQYPSWMDDLTRSEQYKEVVEWMDAAAARYPDLPLIDVVNEAIIGHAPAPFRDALGGAGTTGYDWIIKAFEMAHERWPDAILIYNDYNTFQWNRTEFVNLVRTIRDAGAPVDAYGCQSHDLTDISFSDFKNAMNNIQNTLKMPMYSTEYDIGTADDSKQLKQYRDQIPYMWEKDYFAGLTLWGYVYGCTWVTDGNSGIIRDGEDRPAMTWLREYMASDAARTAKGPFPGGVKEASLYVQPSHPYANVNEPFDVNLRARLRTKTIDHIDFYVDNVLVQTVTQEPYVATFTPTDVRRYNLKAVMYDTEGNTYERLGGVKANAERKPFLGEPVEIPGTIEAENFDICGEGASFHDSDSKNEGDGGDYRSDGDGVDIGRGNSGYVIGYTAAGEWLEYTVDITQSGLYDFEVVASSGMDGSALKLSLNDYGSITDITNEIAVPNTGDWNDYQTITGHCKKKLNVGRQVIRVTITGSYLNLDKVSLMVKKAGIDSAVDDSCGTFEVYTTTGINLGSVVCTPADRLTLLVKEFTGKAGIYLLRNISTGESVKIAVRD